MDPMISLGPLLVFLLFAAPGARLLTMAYRTRESPELFCGLYFTGAAVGLSMRVLGSSLFPTQPDLAEPINSIGHVAFAAGTISMTVFTLRVFHPSSMIARVFALTTISAIVLTSLHTLIGGYASVETSYSMIATNFMRLVPTSWAFYESLRYWRSMQRRQALGLADPVVTNRFLLWSVWTGAVSALPMIPLLLRFAGVLVLENGEAGQQFADEILPRLLMGIRILFATIAPIAAIALSLSFFPPTAYVERVRARAEVNG
jgi:hypothetical protein